MENWYASIYKGLIYTGVIAFIVGFFTQGNTSFGAYISSYSVLILAIMMILIVIFNKITEVSQNKSMLQVFSTILMTTGPFILMLFIIAFILYLLITYKDNILSKHVSSGYYSFSNVFVILLSMQLYLIYTNITTDSFENTGRISSVTSSIIYLLGVLSGITSIILFTILHYYTTDGFQNNYSLVNSL